MEEDNVYNKNEINLFIENTISQLKKEIKIRGWSKILLEIHPDIVLDDVAYERLFIYRNVYKSIYDEAIKKYSVQQKISKKSTGVLKNKNNKKINILFYTSILLFIIVNIFLFFK